MGMPAAKSGDKVVALDMHIVMVPSPGGPVPTPLPHPFNGVLTSSLSANVMVGGMPAATVGSMATNMPIHFPTPPGTMFQKPPSNQATIQMGSATVRINGKPAARNGDTALTCGDPVDMPAGIVIAVGTVMIG
jgi:uncharacterized Zn-binding protein involved in type VI secretion